MSRIKERKEVDVDRYDKESVTWQKINDEFEDFMWAGSGWVLDEISSIYLNIARL